MILNINSKKTVFNRLIVGTFNYGIGNIASKLIGFLLIPVYTAYLKPEDYGLLEICSSMALFLIVFFRLGLPGAISRYYFDFKDDKEKLRNYVSTIHKFLLTVDIIFGIILAVIFFLFDQKILKGVPFNPFIILIILQVCFSSNSEIQKRLLRASENSRYSAKLNFVFVTVSLLLSITLVVGFKMKALGFILAQFISSLIFFIQAQYYLRHYLGGKFERKYLKASLDYGLKILPHTLFVVLAPFLSKLILNQISNSSLGIFSVAQRFNQPLDMFFGMFSMSFGAVFFSLRNENYNKEKLNQICAGILIFSSILMLCSVTIMQIVIPNFTPKVYHSSVQLLPILGLGFIAQMIYLIFSQDLFFEKKVQLIPLTTGLGLLVNILISFIFIRHFQELAISWAFAFGFISWAVMAILLHYKYVDNKLRLSVFKKPILILAVVLIIIFLNPITNIFFKTLFIGLASIIAYYLIDNQTKEYLLRKFFKPKR